jgi:hypothetical protein
MSFLNNIKGAPMPPVKNIFKDALQMAKQSLPDLQKQQHYEDPTTSEYGGSSQISSHSSHHHRPPQTVHFADSVGDGQHQQAPTEMNPLNPFLNPNGYGYDDNSANKSDYQYEETGFNQGGDYGSYQQGGFPAR